MASFRAVCGRSASFLVARSVRLQFAKLSAVASGSESTDVVTHTGQVFLARFPVLCHEIRGLPRPLS